MGTISLSSDKLFFIRLYLELLFSQHLWTSTLVPVPWAHWQCETYQDDTPEGGQLCIQTGSPKFKRKILNSKMLSLEIFEVYESKERVPPPHRPVDHGKTVNRNLLIFSHRGTRDPPWDSYENESCGVNSYSPGSHTHCPPWADHLTQLSPHL